MNYDKNHLVFRGLPVFRVFRSPCRWNVRDSFFSLETKDIFVTPGGTFLHLCVGHFFQNHMFTVGLVPNHLCLV